jgi:hypothetical protein
MKTIFEIYEPLYPGIEYDSGVPGPNDPHMEIDIPKIAKRLKCRPELIHGILYFHLNEIYGYKTSTDAVVRLFEKNVGNKVHCVNFPYLAAKFASLESERRNVNITRILSITALGLSALALGAKLFGMQ